VAVLIVLAAIGLCAAVLFAGIVAVVSVAIRREDKNHTLTTEATGRMIRMGRRVNGVYIRAPRDAAAVARETTRV
jgi:hypothetical protein